MTVKQLKEQLAGVPDDALVVLRTSDHAYRRAFVDSCTAISEDNYLFEDFGDPPKKREKRVAVLLFN